MLRNLWGLPKDDNNIVLILAIFCLIIIILSFCIKKFIIKKYAAKYINYEKIKVARYFEYTDSNHKKRYNRKIALKVREERYDIYLDDVTIKVNFANIQHPTGSIEMFVKIPKINKNIPEHIKWIVNKALKEEIKSLKATKVIYK